MLTKQTDNITLNGDSQKTQADNSLDWLLSPIPKNSFYNEYFEKKHLHLKRNNPEFYKSVLQIKHLEDLLQGQVMKYPAVRLTNATEDIAPDKYVQSEKVNSSSLLKYFTEGSTIVMSGLHEYLAGLGELVGSLSKNLYHKFQTNIYITPKNSQGFKVHHDTHDVFVLQVHGRKSWKIYTDNPLTLPNKMQEFEPGKYQHGPLLEELVMETGDLLYIPRGVMHQAETNDALSIHITLGMLGYTWTDLLVESILELSKKEVKLRKFLPSDMLKNGAAENHEEYFKQLFQLMSHRINLQDSINRFKREMAGSQKPNIAHLLQTGDAVSDINKDSTFSVRKNVLYLIKKRESNIILEWLGKEVEFPNYTEEAIHYISKVKGKFSIQDIPDCIDEEGKIVLVARLIKEGLIKIETI